MDLDKRKQLILAAIVDEYIAHGEPVGSRAVAAKLGNAYSSATIRNEMAALTELALIEQPHTSAGRVPSYLGYRFYIEKLMNLKPLSGKERKAIESLFHSADADIEKFLEKISNYLAEITNCVSLTTTPVVPSPVFSHIELVPFTRRTFLLVYITTAGTVKNRICRLELQPGAEILERFVRAVNAELATVSVEEISPAFIQTLGSKLGELAFVFSPLLLALYQAAEESAEGQLILEGRTNLLSHREFAGDPKVVMDFLARQDILRGILMQSGGGAAIFRGSEFGDFPVPIGIIVSKYHTDGNSEGSIGIIGPQRIDYPRLIPYIEYFAELVGRLLTDIFGED
ncbi:MAG: heat-inducible transcriptional repressor HrcA [Oscillospiraceae bacterium]|jgi:heat-inducible transcriptional repressor|nr:heat-inducible transcriptional repressor HrcA [Oscillospiraceae bacterium]